MNRPLFDRQEPEERVWKLHSLEELCDRTNVSAELRRQCFARMEKGFEEHRGEPLEDWRKEAIEEIADAINYCALGEEISERVLLCVSKLAICYRLLTPIPGSQRE